MQLIIDAIAIAAKAHVNQRRKYNDTPYINHPIRVAEAYSGHNHRTEIGVAACYLHDVIEDTDITAEQLIPLVGERVVKLVLELTNPSKGLEISRSDKKKMDREHISRNSIAAKLIKLYDRIDNLNEISAAPLSFRHMYASESLALVEVIREADEELAETLIGIANDLLHDKV